MADDSQYVIDRGEYFSSTTLPANAKLTDRAARERLLNRSRQRILDRARDERTDASSGGSDA